jgi:hypothetical protein
MKKCKIQKTMVHVGFLDQYGMYEMFNYDGIISGHHMIILNDQNILKKY